MDNHEAVEKLNYLREQYRKDMYNRLCENDKRILICKIRLKIVKPILAFFQSMDCYPTCVSQAVERILAKNDKERAEIDHIVEEVRHEIAEFRKNPLIIGPNKVYDGLQPSPSQDNNQ